MRWQQSCVFSFLPCWYPASHQIDAIQRALYAVIDFQKTSMHLKLLHLKCSWNWNENLPWLAVWLGTSSSSWNISGALFFIFLAFKVWFQRSCWYLLFMFTIRSNGSIRTSTEYQTFPLQAYSIRDKNNFIFSLFLPN